MALKQELSSRARKLAKREIDPRAVRRAKELVRRRKPGQTSSSDVDRGVDELRELVLDDFVRRARRGSLGEADQARLASLTDASLARLGATPADSTRDALCTAFEALYEPRRQPTHPPHERITRAIVDSFHKLYYNASYRTWQDTWYRGVQIYKCPTDMWMYQELIDDLKPGLVIETGTYRGGSGLFIADRLEILGHGEIVTIDIDVQPDRPEHPRLTYLTGSSVDEQILDDVRGRLPTDGSPVLVILDSDHSRDHVFAELQVYAPMVTVGSYVIVEDTNVNGHPTEPDYGPGPWEAARDFLVDNPGFVADHTRERYYLTQNPDGFLRRDR